MYILENKKTKKLHILEKSCNFAHSSHWSKKTTNKNTY